MLNKNGLKTVGVFVKDILTFMGPVVTAKWLFSDQSTSKPVAAYDDAISAILHSSMFVEDKAKAAGAIKMDARSEYYNAIIAVANSSMFSDAKLETILKLSSQMEEA